VLKIAYRILCLHMIFFIVSAFFVGCENSFVKRHEEFDVSFYRSLTGVVAIDATLLLLAFFVFLIHEVLND
jgi:hypothetical protein